MEWLHLQSYNVAQHMLLLLLLLLLLLFFLGTQQCMLIGFPKSMLTLEFPKDIIVPKKFIQMTIRLTLNNFGFV